MACGITIRVNKTFCEKVNRKIYVLNDKVELLVNKKKTRCVFNIFIIRST